MPKEKPTTRNRQPATTTTPASPDTTTPKPEIDANDDDGIIKLPPIPIVKATGRIAYDRMHGTTKEKVDAMLAANAHAVSGAASAAMPLPVVFEALRMLNGAITLAVGVVTKAPKDIVIECSTFSDAQLNRLGPSSQAVLTKYAPKIDRWAVEVEFGMTFYNVVQEMISETRMRNAARIAEAKAREEPTS